MKLKILAAFSLSALMGLAHAGQKWEAMSNTAMSITGSIQLNADRTKLIFENGQAVSLKPVGGSQPTLYRVEGDTTKPMKNGNSLCDDDVNASFMRIQVQNDTLTIAVFNGDAPPTTDDSACGIFSYFQPK